MKATAMCLRKSTSFTNSLPSLNESPGILCQKQNLGTTTKRWP